MEFFSVQSAANRTSGMNSRRACVMTVRSSGAAPETDFQIGDRIRIRPGFADSNDIGKEGRVVRAEAPALYPFHVLLGGQAVAWPVHAHEIERVEALSSAA